MSTGRGTDLDRIITAAALFTAPPQPGEVRRLMWGTGIVMGFGWGVVLALLLEASK